MASFGGRPVDGAVVLVMNVLCMSESTWNKHLICFNELSSVQHQWFREYESFISWLLKFFFFCVLVVFEFRFTKE